VDPGSGAFLTLDPGSNFGIRDEKKILEPGSGINIPDLIFEKYVSVFWVKNNEILRSGSGSGMEKFGFGIVDPV
jgi:hypothetical protein